MEKGGGWSLEHGYPPEVGRNTYPRRALFAGTSYALEAKLKVHQDDFDYFCGSSLQGYKVICFLTWKQPVWKVFFLQIQISHPSRIPRVREQHFQLPINQMIQAAVTPDMTTTSNSVRAYKAEKRNCYFPSEQPLQYFKVYSQQNCQVECKSRFVYENCGCVHFYMPSMIFFGFFYENFLWFRF